jgi:hypothetical protein
LGGTDKGGAGPDVTDFDPRDEQLTEIMLTVDDKIEFGEPQDPSDPTASSTVTLAGGTGAAPGGVHNGTHSNIAGSWVEVEIQGTGEQTFTCTHNLYLDSVDSPQYTMPVSDEPNCRWLSFGTAHDGTAADASSVVGCTIPIFIQGDTISANAIKLRTHVATAGTPITVDATHPILLTLFFTRATKAYVDS